MIEKVLPFQFIKKSPLYGSFRGMNYRIMGKGGKLEACAYPGPYIFAKTPEEKKIYAEFDYSETGYNEALDFLNREYESGEWAGK